MYRKRNGSLGFSFTRFAEAAVPSFWADPPPSVSADLSPLRHDMAYAHQISSSNPYFLDERVFYVSGVVDSESLSKKVYKLLCKNEILKDGGRVDTYGITSKFVHQMAVLSLRRQRELIGLLFWWEEECQRLKKLDMELKELNELIDEKEKILKNDDGHGEEENREGQEELGRLRFARERVRMKKRQRPSQRDPLIEADQDDIVAAFHGRRKSEPANLSGVGGGRNNNQNGNGLNAEERPPEYYAPQRT